MAKVIWTESAREDLSQIFDYLAQSSQSIELAERICTELLSAAYERIGEWPDSGSLVPEGRELACASCIGIRTGSSMPIAEMPATSCAASTPVATWPASSIHRGGREPFGCRQASNGGPFSIASAAGKIPISRPFMEDLSQ